MAHPLETRYRETQGIIRDPRILTALNVSEQVLSGETNLLSPVEVARLLQNNVALALGEDPAKLREIHDDALERLGMLWEFEPGVKIVLRHGEQQHFSTFNPEKFSPEELSFEKKVDMMRPIWNRTDRPTPLTIAEACTVGYLINEAQQREQEKDSPRRLVLEASYMPRADGVARIFGAFTNQPVTNHEEWYCISYKPNEGSRDITAAELRAKGVRADGTVPWDKTVIDAVAGIGSFQRITDGVVSFIETPIAPRTTVIVITHTQQLQALAAAFGEEGRRPDYFGGYALISQSEPVYYDSLVHKRPA